MILTTIILLLLGGTHKKENLLQTCTTQCQAGATEANSILSASLSSSQPRRVFFSRRLAYKVCPSAPATHGQQETVCSERCLHCPDALPHKHTVLISGHMSPS